MAKLLRAAVLSLLGALVFPIAVTAQQPSTLRVNRTDPTCGGQSPCFTIIQAAINAAGPGRSIQIQGGTYPEKSELNGKNNFQKVLPRSTQSSLKLIRSRNPWKLFSTGAPGACTGNQAIRLQQNMRMTRDFTISVLDENSRVRFDAAADERAHQPAAQLVGDLALVERQRLELHADGGQRRRPATRRRRPRAARGPAAPHAGSRSIDAPTSRIVPDHAIDVLAVGDPHVDDRVRELLAEVRERGDRAVRKHLHRAFAVAQDDRPQVDLLDGARRRR